MGVILKYQLEFPEIGLKVSNDIFSGEYNIDATITVDMKRQASGGSFNVELIDLPMDKVEQLKARIPTLGKVIISLGYIDSPFGRVMEGIIEKITTAVKEGKLVTTIVGLESGTYTLKNNVIDSTFDDELTFVSAVRQVLSDSEIRCGAIDQNPQLPDIPGDFGRRTFRQKKVMDILNNLASKAQVEFMVSDGKVWMGKPIKDDLSYQPPPLFDRDVNLADFSQVDKEVPQQGCRHATRADGFRFMVLGDPKLRPGQEVKATDAPQSEKFRIHSIAHKFTSAGYVCEGSAMKVVAEGNFYQRERTFGISGATSVADGVNELSENGQRSRPTIEIGKVKTYTAGEASGAEKHVSALYFGQTFDDTETQPSVNIAIDNNEQRLFRGKPIVSPFAWHKCGLVVPVYEGMKSVLSHNLNLQDDVLVNGFIWSSTPEIEPPKNKVGDWWLCLPIDFDTASPPSASTKAVNDLTANNGKRVIDAKGLKISIGSGALGNVGDRPQEGNDDECLIEHSSGAKILLKSGEIQLTDGSVTLKVANGSVSVS